MHRSIAYRRPVLWAVLGVTLVIAGTVAVDGARSELRTASGARARAKPTTVLVNGAWANNASWSGVIARLQAEGYAVDAPPNPLQSLRGDAATIRDFLDTIHGPVVLVGHSYGGMVISDAATGDHNVKALVYVDAFVPKKGESALGLDAIRPGSALGAPSSAVFDFVAYPGAAKGDSLVYVKQSVFVHAFANGLPTSEGAALAATQSPAVYSALTARSSTPAWRTVSSWYVLGTIDNAIPPAIHLFMARRIHGHITRVHAGHLSIIADPGTVSRVIETAARATG